MKNRQSLVETSKFLSYVLRHEPQAIGLLLDREGWGPLDTLIAGAAGQGRILTPELIAEVVTTNEKKRFEMSADGLRIRAVQGHSIADVDRSYIVKQPPDRLFHGTATRFLDAIRREGLKPGSRHHVHLSADERTALDVGRRYGTPTLLQVEAQQMYAQGHAFYQAENGVWLTPHVPVSYIRF